MINKKLIVSLAIAAAVTVPVSVFAATSDSTAAVRIRGFFGIDTSKLTDTQNADITTYNRKMADLQKEFINKMVSNGTITREQGDAAIARIDEALKNGEIDFIKGFEGGKGFRGGFSDLGYTGGLFGIDTTKLTDTQKSDLKAELKKTADLQKNFISQVVSAGLATKDQGDTQTKVIDAIVTELDSGDFTGSVRLLNGFERFGLAKGKEASRLTDTQKKIFTDFKAQFAALEKELVNKMVDNGALTKDQGTAAVNRIDNMGAMQEEMGKGHFGGHGDRGGGGMFRQNIPNNTTNGTSSGAQS